MIIKIYKYYFNYFNKMKYTCKICKEKSVNINCCKYINNELYKFCNRCGNKSETIGWYKHTNFPVKKVKKNNIIDITIKQKTCYTCRQIKLDDAKESRLNQGKCPRRTINDNNNDYFKRYLRYLDMVNSNKQYILYDDDYDNNEYVFL